MSTTHILLVDDEIEFTDTLSERLHNRGMDVDVASNGEEAVRKIREKTYDAVILDMAMPGLSGIDTLKMMLEKRPDLQVIFLTGKATVQKSVEALKLGARDFLEKPVDINALSKKIKDAEADHMVLVEKELEEKIKKIMTKKSW
jgi:DNA-binding NtrC family response regulator